MELINKQLVALSSAVILTITSCNKEYKYVDLTNDGLFTKEDNEKIFSAPSDSVAYIDAYRRFCSSKRIYTEMVEKGMPVKIPIGFRVYNSKGIDISYTSFATKAEQESKIESENAMKDNGINNISKGTEHNNTIDSTKINELLPFFNVKKDEFDPNAIIWYKPKSAPKYTNQNGIYLYFSSQDGKIRNLRFRIQYYSDSWLFFKKIQFSIDDEAYEFIPSKTEYDSGNGGKIWEWFDEALTNYDKKLIYALTEAKTAKMKLIGRQYYDIKEISKEQITGMKRTLELYKAMGGKY